MRPFVLEADRIGWGSAGRSAGLLLSDPGVAFRDIAKAHGLRAARRIFEGYRKALSTRLRTLRRLNIRCDLQSCDDVLVAIRDGEKAATRARRARRRRARREMDLASGDARRWRSTRWEPSARARASRWIRIERASVWRGRGASRGANFFERSPVKKVRVGQKQVDVIVDGGLIHADKVIVTTGIATTEFKPLRRHFKRRETVPRADRAAARRRCGSSWRRRS